MQSQKSQIAVTPQQKKTLGMSAIVLEAREWLLNSVSGMVSRYEDAEDIVQDVFHQFTGAYGELRSLEATSAWLYRTARNKVSDFYRKRARTIEGSHSAVQSGDIEEGQFLENLLQDPELHSASLLDQSQLQERLETAIEELPELQREVFIWHEIEGLSFKEIAKLTGDSQNTLLSRKRYAVLALRKKLNDLYK
ncbi:MAG: RNA polymerase sigma factor [Candidatus Marinimicrobia bacterium]|jgi:RNA polymerase sigma factor (sigma-70 family)|nr:RNA polymerase sigma factor [Candidatus Neomarinimicrobiota bacterium]MBT3632566.1 RNA polymerase sigma factor [Candidatus Neomarinimicrobiota bacterium]MBT3824965.1 RNA polymerase sigma factor [Candidatus Neomarinimicrobiota bacterium]MBT4295244.1 RNA polymerase sigma factor [Candidatus Neomarinimicrobiota bacterium]MBT4420392.1 RNA polymerase sigma factor [Candidatus Neomarinimicrobiota bacterium]